MILGSDRLGFTGWRVSGVANAIARCDPWLAPPEPVQPRPMRVNDANNLSLAMLRDFSIRYFGLSADFV